jgi:hypothetical protein
MRVVRCGVVRCGGGPWRLERQENSVPTCNFVRHDAQSLAFLSKVRLPMSRKPAVAPGLGSTFCPNMHLAPRPRQTACSLAPTCQRNEWRLEAR